MDKTNPQKLHEANEREQSVRKTFEELRKALTQMSPLIVAVSGGIDSTVLAVVAGRLLGKNVQMAHAVSPAVPKLATRRVKRYADNENWSLSLCNVGEFSDDRYIENPINRCFYCKTNLYQYISEQFGGCRIASGTNCDDLNDFRPGLEAAEQFGVCHPYVDAGVSKEGIRDIARLLSLDDLSELPASPCLSSRVETGIEINSQWLRAVDQIEIQISQFLNPATVRCRIRHDSTMIELDAPTLANLTDLERAEIRSVVSRRFAQANRHLPVIFAEYSMGSAFIQKTS